MGRFGEAARVQTARHSPLHRYEAKPMKNPAEHLAEIKREDYIHRTGDQIEREIELAPIAETLELLRAGAADLQRAARILQAYGQIGYRHPKFRELLTDVDTALDLIGEHLFNVVKVE